MSQPSNWPLPETGRRLLTPTFIRKALAEHPLSGDCFPTAMGFYPNAAGHAMQRAQHDDNLVLLCTEGRGLLRTGGDQVPITAGDAVLLPRHQGHYYRASKQQPWTIYWVHFTGKLAPDLMRYLATRGQHVIHPGVQPDLVTGFQQLLQVERTGYDLGSYIAAANQLRQLLVRIANYRDQQARHKRGEFDISAIQRHMREQVSRPLTLQQLAAIAGVSKSHFAQRYRQLTGYAPIRHFTHMKIEAACRLLDSSQQSVKQVAAALGYDDPLYFSRVFRRVVGVSPREYRSSVSA